MAWKRRVHGRSGMAARGLAPALALIWMLIPAGAEAQAPGCVLQQAGFPSRQVLRCQDGLTVEAERGADYTLLDSDRDGNPDAVNLRSRALLIDLPAAPRGRRFEILTPQAVAAVRGTQWAVDVDGGKTAVFVISGRVQVRRVNLRTGVTLGPGEGVDVDQGAGPLTVRRWPEPRVRALLARFGR